MKKLTAQVKNTVHIIREVTRDELSVRFPNYGKYVQKFYEVMTFLVWCTLLLLPGFVLVFTLWWALKDESDKS